MRQRIIIASIAFILLVGGGSLALWLVNRSPALQNAIYKATNTTAPIDNRNTNAEAVKPTTPDRESTIFVARNFTEVYGSFSNQNGGSNLTEAQIYATSSYAAVLRAQAAATKVALPTAEYSGTITRALVFTNIKLLAATAQIVVSTQQDVTTGTSTKTQLRDLLVDLVKVDGEWKVNAAVWK